MKETKFRAWDLDRKEFDFFDLDSYDKHKRDVYGTLEQFTGLHDKSGVEIYEGDILFVRGSTLHFVVKWVTEWARFMLEDHRKWLVPMESSLLEVVGNIHENPELLKAGDA